MATTLYGNFPILLPNKTVSVSLYGLQKTSGTILFKPGQEDAARDLAEQEGAVFPDPQVRTTDMGLLEMAFDAYRDTGQTSGSFGTELLNFSKSFQDEVSPVGEDTPDTKETYNWTVTEIWLADSYTHRRVMDSRMGSVSLVPFSATLGKKRLRRIITGKKSQNGASQLSITWMPQVSSVTRRNFGTFDEVDIVTSLDAIIA